MKKLLLFTFLFLAMFAGANAQSTDCPSDKVCISQDTANKLFATVDQLIAAKDVIAKMLAERGVSDTAIANALKVIDGWKELDVINGMMITKYEKVVALYEKTLDLAFTLIERLEKQLTRGKTGWDKFLNGLKRVLDIAAGVALGRVF